MSQRPGNVRRAFVLVASAALVASCTALSGLSDLAREVAGSEGGAVDGAVTDVVADSASDAAREMDAGPADVAVDAARDCGLISTVTDDPVDLSSASKWTTLGLAQLRTGYGQLTPQVSGQGSALLWIASTPILLDQFDVAFDFSITYSPDAAVDGIGDGLAFVAVQTLPTVCQAGGKLCVLTQGISGMAAVLRTYQNSLEPAAPYATVVPTKTFIFPADMGPPLGMTPSATLSTSIEGLGSPVDDTMPPPDATWHRMRVTVAGAIAFIYIDGVIVLSDVSVPSTVGLSGYWGFTSGTGGALSRMAVRRVKMTVSTPGCGD